jgi:flavorubredoxin
MQPRLMRPNVHWVGAVDWDRRLFDSLIPLPDGTTYNAYLVRGSEKTALLDTVDPSMTDVLMENLQGVPKIDYLIAHHAEQDHSGSIPAVLAKYPQAKLVVTPKCKPMLMAFLDVAEERFLTVEDGQTLSLGDKTLEFIYLPWVHWPETMGTYLREERLLFSCDFFGSHIASTDLYVADEPRVYEAAKRYFAEIMMPFRAIIQKNMEKLKGYDITMIAPSHGSVYDRPAFIMDAYRDWISGEPKNMVVVPYISMHGSTKKMVDHFIGALVEKGVSAQQFDLAVSDLGKLAMSMVDAATIVIGTPTVMVNAHPNAVYAAYLANALRPKVKYVSVIGSYGWATKAVEQLAGMLTNLKVEVLEPVYCKGYPQEADLKALDRLAAQIAERHKGLA